MKKRSCRMTSEEKAVHEFAVKVRKMTDRQLFDFIHGKRTETVKTIKENTIKEGFVGGN